MTHREFQVHGRHLDRHHARVVTDASFEAAAVAYVEDFALADGETAELSVVVRDLATGDERCFHIDLATGEAEPCA